jgi:hypothetical protein
MPSNNSTPVPGYDFSGVADRAAQMVAYDTLPTCVRQALDDAPFEICCIATLDYYEDHGEEETIREIERSAAMFLSAAERENVYGSHNA